MLVNDNFLYLNLPRSASTSFTISCLKRNIKLKHFNKVVDDSQSKINLQLDNETIADSILHNHEGIIVLNEKFGTEYDIISVKRDKYERWISIWKHCIDEIHKIGDKKTYEKLITLTEDDVLDFDSNMIASYNLFERDKLIENFIDKYELNKENKYLTIIFSILFTPFSHYHNFDKRIKWFDFDKLFELEEWVSDRLKLNFKLEKINSSQHFDCKIYLTDNFKKKYNQIFDRYDNPKLNKTFI